MRLGLGPAVPPHVELPSVEGRQAGLGRGKGRQSGHFLPVRWGDSASSSQGSPKSQGEQVSWPRVRVATTLTYTGGIRKLAPDQFLFFYWKRVSCAVLNSAF